MLLLMVNLKLTKFRQKNNHIRDFKCLDFLIHCNSTFLISFMQTLIENEYLVGLHRSQDHSDFVVTLIDAPIWLG